MCIIFKLSFVIFFGLPVVSTHWNPWPSWNQQWNQYWKNPYWPWSNYFTHWTGNTEKYDDPVTEVPFTETTAVTVSPTTAQTTSAPPTIETSSSTKWPLSTTTFSPAINDEGCDIGSNGRDTCEQWINFCNEATRCLNSTNDYDCDLLAYTPLSQMGTSFMFSFLSSENRVRQPSVLILSREATNVTVTVPFLDMQETYLVDGYKEVVFSKELILDIDWELALPTIENNGVEIKSDFPISVFTLSDSTESSSGTIVLPESLLGLDYYTNTFPSERTAFEEVVITATKDNTTVFLQIIGVAFYVTLDKFETQICKFDRLYDMRITADHPVFVQIGHDCAHVPDENKLTCDALATTIIPTGHLRTVYIVPAMYPRKEFTVGISSFEDDNNVSVSIGNEFGNEIVNYTGIVPRHTTFQDNSAVTITSTDPLLVTLLGHSSSGDLGDASMTFVPSPNQYTNFYQFYVPSDFSSGSHLCIIIYDRFDVFGLRLNSQEITPVKTSSTVLPCTGRFYILYIDLQSGLYTLNHVDPMAKFGAFLFARANGKEYSSFLGLEIPLVP